jgi:hypothetical protein
MVIFREVQARANRGQLHHQIRAEGSTSSELPMAELSGTSPASWPAGRRLHRQHGAAVALGDHRVLQRRLPARRCHPGGRARGRSCGPGHQRVAGRVDGGTVLVMEGEMGIRRPVSGAERGEALAGVVIGSSTSLQLSR